MRQDSREQAFRQWIKSRLHDQFDPVAKEPIPKIIQSEIDKLMGEKNG